MSEDELRLVLDAQQGDKPALAKLLRQNQDLIFRFCCSRLGEPASARDATQETALRVIDSISRFEGKAKLKTWLLGIANNVCREFSRKQSRWHLSLEEPIGEPGTAGHPTSAMIEAENVEQLN